MGPSPPPISSLGRGAPQPLQLPSRSSAMAPPPAPLASNPSPLWPTTLPPAISSPLWPPHPSPPRRLLPPPSSQAAPLCLGPSLSTSYHSDLFQTRATKSNPPRCLPCCQGPLPRLLHRPWSPPNVVAAPNPSWIRPASSEMNPFRPVSTNGSRPASDKYVIKASN